MTRKSSYFSVLSLALGMMFFGGEALRAQVTTATISGVLRDETAAVLPGTQVTVRNVDTGQTRVVTSDERGRYRASQLPVGSYEVRAELAGFQTSVRSGILLTLGQEAEIDLVLSVGAITQQVQVTGEAPLIETTATAVGGLVDVDMISELPLNGRSFQQLVALQAGVVVVSRAASDISQGKGDRVSVSGARATANAYSMDGLSLESQMGKIPVSISGNMLGVEGIREFNVLTNSYSAQYGGAGGAVVNMVTRSGTNEIHGSLYAFHRNSALDAKNFFDKLDKPIPPFKRNQFGGGLGGPIVKDRTFFFVNYESLRERLGVTQIGTVPDENARKGLIPKGGVLTNVGVKDAVKPYLALYPLPNGRNFGNGIAEYLSSPSQPTDEHFGLARIDHRFSDSDSIFGRYVIDDARVAIPETLNLVPRNEGSRQQSALLEEVKLITPNLINVLRLGYARSLESGFNNLRFPEETAKALAYPYSFIPFGLAGGNTVGGLSFLGGLSQFPKNMRFNHFQLNENMSYTKGSHFMNFGFEAKRFRFNLLSDIQRGGTYTFDTLETMLAGNARSFNSATVDWICCRYIRWNNFGLFFQDEWRVSGRLILNLGMRYDWMTLPTLKNGESTNWGDPLARQTTPGPLFENPTLKNFQPRIGLAWDVFGNGKTSIRSALGVFSPPFHHSAWQVGFYRQPPNLFAVSSNPPFPNVLAGGRAPSITLNVNQAQESKPANPAMIQYNFSIQQEVSRDTALRLAYVGSHGYHLERPRNANMAYPQILADGRKYFPPGSQPRNPVLAAMTYVANDANSFYNSFQIELIKRLSGGFRIQGNYTFSKSVDDGQGQWDAYDESSKTAQDADDKKSDRGLSSFDIRHKAVISYAYEFPLGSGKAWGNSLSGVADRLVSGWSASGITSLAGGYPITIRNGSFGHLRAYRPDIAGRPNLKPGASNSPVLGGPDRYYDLGAFELQPIGFFGNLGRNTLIVPGLVNFDFSLVKNTRIREGQNLEFRAEFFNLFNRPNFGSPGGVAFLNASGTPNPLGGRISRTLTTSRQIQFALKLTF